MLSIKENVRQSSVLLLQVTQRVAPLAQITTKGEGRLGKHFVQFVRTKTSNTKRKLQSIFKELRMVR